MHGDLDTLYDAHAHRLYAHCWSLLGGDGAADALTEVFTEAVRHSAREETVLWLHRLARTVCSGRGAFAPHHRPVLAPAGTDPLLDAAAGLPAGHREVLLLAAGEWLETGDIAQVLRVSPGTVQELLHEARTLVERAVLDTLMRGAADPASHPEVIAAFEKGRLANLLARRAPALAPAPLRERVLAAADGPGRAEAGRPASGGEPAGPAERPLVVIGPDAGGDRDGAARRRTALKGAGAVAGVAATVAAGLVMTWPSTGDNASANALGPSGGDPRPGSSPAGNVSEAPATQHLSQERPQAETPAPATTTEGRTPVTEEPARTPEADPSRTPEPARSAPTTPPATATAPDGSWTPSPSQPPSPQPEPDQPKRPDDGPHRHNPLKPITDLVDSITSPILGGLTGHHGSGD